MADDASDDANDEEPDVAPADGAAEDADDEVTDDAAEETAPVEMLFDVEIMFLVPWAVHFDALGWFGLIAVVLFLFNITIAYVYEWRRGGLDWD